jgi:hypothetical protein
MVKQRGGPKGAREGLEVPLAATILHQVARLLASGTSTVAIATPPGPRSVPTKS